MPAPQESHPCAPSENPRISPSAGLSADSSTAFSLQDLSKPSGSHLFFWSVWGMARRSLAAKKSVWACNKCSPSQQKGKEKKRRSDGGGRELNSLQEPGWGGRHAWIRITSLRFTQPQEGNEAGALLCPEAPPGNLPQSSRADLPASKNFCAER